RYLKQFTASGMTILPDENHVVDPGTCNNADRPWVYHNLSSGFVSGRFNHTVDTHLNVAAVERDFRLENFRFGHSYSFSGIVLKAFTNLAICLGVITN